MINNYLEEVRKNLLLNTTQYEKSDTSMRSKTNDDVAIEDIQRLNHMSQTNLSQKILYKRRNIFSAN
ncbi:hypothetical protein H5410_043189 [Solanum commersonii]|uniref:Uncharacterized protein n=1 Tax=Solanum commersonii TaxID=4109 RepID=A0A9J5XWH3_SOLCO|nr:hypothetical protein H5410_043189 [Solanum commersonii]